MLLPDVNVLIYAYRPDTPRHVEYRGWLEQLIAGPSLFGLSDIVLSGFVRITTHPKVFARPNRVDDALNFCATLRTAPTHVSIVPGPRHWDIFHDLCRRGGAKGNLVPDAYLAALAVEHGCEFVTADRGFARFPGLRWRHPLD